MHWLLTVPDTFSLREVIRRSGWLLIPSLHGKTMGDHLYRVEDLDGTAVKLDIYQAPAGLVVQSDPHLSGTQIEEASQRAWRMLRLDENLRPFLRVASRFEGLRAVQRNGARCLRGTSLYEDVITAQLASWDDRGFVHFERVAGLIDRIGLALPRNPTLHAFPDAARLLEGADMLVELFGVNLSDRLLAIADKFEHHEAQPEAALMSQGPLETLTSYLSSSLELSAPCQSLLLFSLGRYDHIPTDEMAIRRFRYAYGEHGRVDQEDLLRFFGRFHPWGGLAFWLWEWSKVPEAQAWQT